MDDKQSAHSFNGVSNKSRPPTVVRRSNAGDLLKNLKSVDKSNKKKTTILDQASMDWTKSKVEENLVDELQQATKSKSAYLEQQSFLHRSDLRQFENERAIRTKQRPTTNRK